MKSWFGKFGAIVAGPKTKWITLVIWVILAAVLSTVFPSVNKEETNNASQLPDSAWSVQAKQVQKQYWPGHDGIPALLVWYRQGGLTGADLQSAQNVAKELKNHPVANQESVMELDKMPISVLKSMESKDGTTLVASVELKAHTEDAVIQKDVSDIQKLVTKVTQSDSTIKQNLSHDGLHVRVTGPAGIAADTLSLFANVDVTLLIATVLLVLILLILLYRSPLLAILPLIGVGFAFSVISPILGYMAKTGVITVDAEATSIMTVLLFGAGTDYCLFLITRFREYLYTTQNRYSAMVHAVQGATGAIGMSALTVVVSLLALLFAKSGSIHRFAVPFSLAVLIMAIAGLTLVPALLSIFGRASFYPFVPRTIEMEEARAAKRGRTLSEAKRKQLSGERVGRFNLWLGRTVSTKPWPILIFGLVILGVLAGFAPKINYSYNPLSQLPASMQSREGFTLLSDHFSPGTLAPVQIIVDTEGKSISNLHDKLTALSFVKDVSTLEKSPVNSNYVTLQVTFDQDPYSLQSISEIPTIRNTVRDVMQQAGISDPASHFWVGGETATQYDAKQTNQEDSNLVMPIVIGIIALLLLVYLRSVVATAYLIATVLLSFFGALGAGWLFLHYVLGAQSLQGGIVLYTFIFLVALGEDYNIFMVSRIWQERRTRPIKEAIAVGVSRTSGVITSAGLILAGTFAVLTGMPGEILLDFGTIAAIGVLLDTFVVRPLVVPAITALLGRVAFWPGRATQKDSTVNGNGLTD